MGYFLAASEPGAASGLVIAQQIGLDAPVRTKDRREVPTRRSILVLEIRACLALEFFATPIRCARYATPPFCLDFGLKSSKWWVAPRACFLSYDSSFTNRLQSQATIRRCEHPANRNRTSSY